MESINKINILVIVFLFFLVMPLVSSVPPFAVDTTHGFALRLPEIDSLKANQDYEFSVHVFNVSNGVAITTLTSCNLHLYDSKGVHLIDMVDGTPTHTYDYEFNVTAGNFTEGDYYINVYCNSSAMNQGGDGAEAFKVTNSGYLPTTSEALMYGILLVGLLFITLLVFWAHIGDKALIWKFWWFTITWILMVGITFILWRLSSEFVSGQVFLSNIFYLIWLILMLLFVPFILVLILWTFFMLFIWLFLILPYKDRGFTTEEAWEQVGSRTKIKWLQGLIRYADLFGGKDGK